MGAIRLPAVYLALADSPVLWFLPSRRINNLRLFNSVSGSTPSVCADCFENSLKLEKSAIYACFLVGWVCKALQANARKMGFLKIIVYTLTVAVYSGAREWGRTITALRPPDFESGASASSATRAREQDSISQVWFQQTRQSIME